MTAVQTQTPSFLRGLLVPWSLGSILFIGISSALLAFFQDKGVLGLIGSYFLLSWLFKYAYVLLEHVANGSLESPAVSVEMLGPFEQRPLMQIAWCLIVYLAARTLGGAAGVAVAAVLLAMLPASIAILGLGLGIPRSLNPLAWWQILRGLGWRYLAILGLMAAASALIVAMGKMGVWNIGTIAMAEAAVLTVFSAIGGALFERRLEIDHEPKVSPERQKEKEEREHARELSAMLDEIYAQTRIKRHELALKSLRQWLAHTDERHISIDMHTIVDRVAEWRDADILSLVIETMTTELTARGEPDLARRIHQYTNRRHAF